jgi:membrane protease YdiL (CAAX protease family)
MFKGWFGGSGPFFGALIVIWVFKRERTTTFLGTAKLKSIIMALVPLFLFTAVGADNNISISPHLYGFFLGLTLTVYCILEETGWRGYLQDELSNLKPIVQYLIVGFLWYAWHLSFLGGQPNIVNELKIFLILFLGSIGIGYAVRGTRSIFVAACLHMIGNILVFSSFVKQSISFQNRLFILAVSIFVWTVLLIFWDR